MSKAKEKTQAQARSEKLQRDIDDLESLLYGLEAVVGEVADYVNGTKGGPCNQAHGLQMAALELVDRGLQITGARP